MEFPPLPSTNHDPGCILSTNHKLGVPNHIVPHNPIVHAWHGVTPPLPQEDLDLGDRMTPAEVSPGRGTACGAVPWG